MHFTASHALSSFWSSPLSVSAKLQLQCYSTIKACATVIVTAVVLLHCCCAADEIDAIGTKRYDSHSGGEREIQRTMLELLNQMDGFDALSEVKVRRFERCYLLL